MSQLRKNFNFSVLSFLLGSSGIIVLVTTNSLSMTTGIKKAPYQHFSWLIYIKLTAYVVNFLLIFKPTNFSSFSIHKNGETKTVLTTFRPAIGASPLWTEAVTDHSNCPFSVSKFKNKSLK